MKKKKMTALVSTDLTTDQRVIRISNALQEMGFEVNVIARKTRSSLPLEKYPFGASRISCYFEKGFLQFAEFNIKTFFRLFFIKTDYLLANDLDILAPVYLHAIFRRKKIFYDTHEYFTGVPALENAPFKRRVWKGLENSIFPRLKTVYTVNNSVKKKYEEEYGNDIKVVRNVPITRNVIPIEPPAHWKEKIILLMQGSGINDGRGGLELLKMMKYMPDKYHLVYIGGGGLWETLKEKTKEWNLSSKVEFINRIAPEKLAKYTPLAHLGFTLDSTEYLNFKFNLPNKIFDYIHAGVPVIATSIPEVSAIIEQYKCGICLSSTEPQKMAEEVQLLFSNTELYQQCKENTRIAAKELCWDNEKEKLKAIYTPFL